MTMPFDPRPETRPAPAGGAEYTDSLTDPTLWTYSADGAVTAGTGKARFVNDTGETLRLRNVSLSVGTAPTGADLIVDVNVNGTTAFSAQTGRPKVVAGQTSGSAVPAVSGADVDVAPGAVVTVDVDQVGSTVAGSDLTVTIEAIKWASGQIDWKALRDGYERPIVREAELLPLDVNPA